MIPAEISKAIDELLSVSFDQDWTGECTARANLENLIAAIVAKPPDGWKLVPLEPTREMLLAYESVRHPGEEWDSWPRAEWAAMIAAAPAEKRQEPCVKCGLPYDEHFAPDGGGCAGYLAAGATHP